MRSVVQGRCLRVALLLLSGLLVLSSCVTRGPSSEGLAVALPESAPRQRKPAPSKKPNPLAEVAPGQRLSYSSVPGAGMLVAMTFDDGPHPKLTSRLLDLMAQRGVVGTFFVVGRNVRAHPQLVRRMVAEGHEVASHTDTHPSLTKISEASVVGELERTEKAIVAAAQIKPTLLRPPYGATNERVRRLAFSRFGYLTILWSVDPLDWRRPGPQVVASRLIEGAQPGGILLAHDIHAGTIDAMPAVFDELLRRGYRFVTVSQLLAQGRALP